LTLLCRATYNFTTVNRAPIAFALLLAAGLGGNLPALPQMPPPPQAPSSPRQAPTPPEKSPDVRSSEQTRRVAVELVHIIATVVNRRERLVTDLERAEFRVLEDGQEQKIEFFARETDLPLRVALLLDTSNSIRERLAFEKDAAIDFLHSTLRRRKDQAFLMIFDNEPAIIQNFTDDVGTLSGAVEHQRAGGGTALYDAIVQASNKLAEAPPAPDGSSVRRVIVIITDGDDNLSSGSRGDAVEAAQRAGVAVYCISSSTEWVSATDLSDAKKRVERKYHKTDADKVLDEFASQTGGRAFYPYSVDDLGQSFQDIGVELRSQYSLAYLPTNHATDGRFRAIRVEVTRKGATVRARKGYFATPPAARRASSTPSGAEKPN
jgi:Ca-activated chloride channel family protein